MQSRGSARLHLLFRAPCLEAIMQDWQRKWLSSAWPPGEYPGQRQFSCLPTSRVFEVCLQALATWDWMCPLNKYYSREQLVDSSVKSTEKEPTSWCSSDPDTPNTSSSSSRVFWNRFCPHGQICRRLAVPHVSLLPFARALVFIAHGAGEHSGPYDELAQRLKELSMLVFAHDHGERADTHLSPHDNTVSIIQTSHWDVRFQELQFVFLLSASRLHPEREAF